MATIQNYEIDPYKREQTVEMPDGAQILSAQIFRQTCTLSVLVPSETRPMRRRIEVYPAGADILRHEELRFIASLVLHNGALVLHVFERA